MNSSKKNKETVISENFEKSLQDWKLPPSSASDIYLIENGIFSKSRNYRVKSEEAEIPISDEYSSFTLFSNDLKMTYREFNYLHLGMVQVGLKPTKLGSTKSAVICLRNNTTILRMVESSLRDGPIYFSHVSTEPKHEYFALRDPDLATSLTLDIKINESNSSEMHVEEKVILMFRLHYNAMESKNARLRSVYNFAYESGRTTLCVTKVAQSNRVVSSLVYWDRVSIPERWLVEGNPFSEWERARLDWKEAAGAHVLKVDVPGFSEEEVKVEVEDGGGILRISGERREERGEEGDKWHCAERRGGKFFRRLRLPANAKLDELTVGLEKGVLTVTVPKVEVSKTTSEG